MDLILESFSHLNCSMNNHLSLSSSIPKTPPPMAGPILVFLLSVHSREKRTNPAESRMAWQMKLHHQTLLGTHNSMQITSRAPLTSGKPLVNLLSEADIGNHSLPQNLFLGLLCSTGELCRVVTKATLVSFPFPRPGSTWDPQILEHFKPSPPQAVKLGVTKGEWSQAENTAQAESPCIEFTHK